VKRHTVSRRRARHLVGPPLLAGAAVWLALINASNDVAFNHEAPDALRDDA
jgi:hypothetical protein